MKRVIIISGLILVVAISSGIIFIRHLSHRSVPDYGKDIYLRNMQSEVRVMRDAHAVPAIIASNEQDLYRAAGYVMAQDRLWQMDIMRRASTGRLSEVFGREFLETDMLLRALRIPEQSARILAQTNQVITEALEAFSDGVNQFIEKNINKLPPEFFILGYKPEKWEPEHSVNLTGLMAWEVGGEWSTELILHRMQQQIGNELLIDLVPDSSVHGSYVHPGFMLTSLHKGLQVPSAKLQKLGLEAFTGSNSWAVSGERSVTGKPLFAHDMHLFLFAPGMWYQMHHIIEGQLNVTGVVLPGQPFIVAGHNEKIAWGMTSIMVDNVDFYNETINPENPDQYLFNGQWHDMEVRTHKIGIRRGRPVEHIMRYTHRGLVVTDLYPAGNQVISMQWLGNEHGDEVRSIYLLNRAENWEDFRDALSSFISIAQNINYADADGNIGIQTSAGIPIRQKSQGFVAPGFDDTYDWKGLVPFEELPFSFNPPEGFVISANNRTVPDNYPYYISHWFDPPQRYNRIREMLLKKDKLSKEDFTLMLADRNSKLTRNMLPGLLRELQKMPVLTTNEHQAIKLLQQWDMEYLPEYPQPLIFEKFMHLFIENLLFEHVDEELYQDFLKDKLLARNLLVNIWENPGSPWLENITLGEFTGFTALVHKSFSQSIEWIEKQIGSDAGSWQWGKLHKLSIAHPLGEAAILNRLFGFNKDSYSPGGSFHTVCPYSFRPQEPFKIFHGASHRHIYSTANWDESLSVIPTGTSGIPASKYYGDQTEMYVNNKYRRDLFSPQAVQNAAKYHIRILNKNNQ